jgi:hypothetical protein
VPLLATLLGAVDGNVKRCLHAALWGCLPASLGRTKFGFLVAGGFWAVTLHSSLMVYLKMSLGFPWCRFYMRRLGHAPTPP